ncbi:hypothetical protein CAP36_02840 [Chitinophagaceae bacterium IBVUCB2]|nr:hypothetical protein CAP36_02840 [Chitinophagaceae bacterium IBVUCB2]
MAVCTIFKNFTNPVEDVSLIILSNWIASEKYKPAVAEIRNLIAQGKTEEAQAKKQLLPAFTPSATFKDKRLLPNMEQYSGFVHLDFDKLSPVQLIASFQIIAAIPYTFLCFISPSGNGLKVFIEVKTGAEHHDTAYQQVKQYYENATGLKADVKCKDITRLCFVSHDPQLYKNIYNEKFPVQDIPVQQKPVPVVTMQEPKEDSTASDEYLLIFQQQITFTNQKANYENGNRNNYMYLLASNCNRAGVPQSDTEILCAQHFDLSEREIKDSVNSAYKHHSTEFAKFANSAKMQSAEQQPSQPDDDPLEDYLKTTPTIPDEVYEALPHILKEGARAFTDKRKRDVFFTGAISIISGCLPKVTGIYFNERVYPHLYTFIIAPAASGKGVLKNAKRLGDKYHQKILLQSREAQKIYESELAEYKRLEFKKNKGEPAPEKPQPPPFKIVFIPADCSQARMVEHLQANDGQGIICETEADTMSGAKKQDWGDYSPILRSAFHHEKISISRKTGNEYVEINEPRLAVALSGTPAQAPRLISSAEDGLFSRFLFYAFKNNIEWQDPSPKSNTIVYNDHFEALSDQILQLINLLEQSPTMVELQPSQWQIINTTFPKMLSEVVTFTSEDAAGVVYRLGLVLFRICMIFSALRKHENGDMTETIICTDEDFNTALIIVQTYLQHSLLMFNNLPKQNESMQFHSGDGKRKFFEALPKEFTRKEATEIGTKFKLSARTVDDVLKSCLGVSLTKIKAGSYQRI